MKKEKREREAKVKKRKIKYREKRKQFHIYEHYIKCPLDFVCALLGIVLLSPVMLIIAVLIRINLGKPVIFVQERPG